MSRSGLTVGTEAIQSQP